MSRLDDIVGSELLWPPPPPYEDEGLLSFVTRCAADQFISSQHLIMRVAGQVHANRPTARMNGALDVDGLAACLMTDRSEIERRNYELIESSGRLSFFGAALPSWHIGSSSRRFSPASLRDTPYGPGSWEHELIPFCRKSWEYLTDRCPSQDCRAIQGWRHTTGFENCDRCPAPLTDSTRRTVPAEWQPALSFVSGLVSSCPQAAAEAAGRLPPMLTGMNRGEVFELALRLLPLFGHKSLSRRTVSWWRSRPFRLSAALAQCGEAILGWPESIVTITSRDIGRRSGRNSNTLHNKAGTFFAARWAPADSMTARVVRELAKANQAGSGRESCTATSLSISVVARRLGSGTGPVAQARRSKALKTSLMLRGTELVPAFDRQEIDYLEDRLRNRISASECAARLGIPGYAIDHMVELGELSHNKHPYLALRHPGRPFLDEREVARYEASLQTNIDPAETISLVSLTSIMKQIAGRLKPWATVFKELRSGSIPYAIRPDATRPADAIMVASDATDSILLLASPSVDCPVSGGPRMLTRSDALEVMNQKQKLSAMLAPFEQKSVGRDHRIVPASIMVALSSELIAAPEIEARYGIKPPAALRMLERAGVGRRQGLGWPRNAATAAIEQNFSF